MCAVVEEGKSSSQAGDAQKRFWFNKRFYGIIGNVIAKSMRKSKLVQTRGVDTAMKEDTRTRR